MPKRARVSVRRMGMGMGMGMGIGLGTSLRAPWSLLPTFLLAALTACSSTSSGPALVADASVVDGGGTISASGYGRTCSVESDCVTVAQGNVCDPCGCPSVAISASEQIRYDADFNALRDTCPDAGTLSCAACASVVAVCTAGSCSVASCSDPDGCIVDSGSTSD